MTLLKSFDIKISTHFIHKEQKENSSIIKGVVEIG